jgi:hypothetical protein
VILIQKNPNTYIELSIIQQQWTLYILLDDECIMLNFESLRCSFLLTGTASLLCCRIRRANQSSLVYALGVYYCTLWVEKIWIVIIICIW